MKTIITFLTLLIAALFFFVPLLNAQIDLQVEAKINSFVDSIAVHKSTMAAEEKKLS